MNQGITSKAKVAEELKIDQMACSCGSKLFNVEMRTYKNEKRWFVALCSICEQLIIRKEVSLKEGRYASCGGISR